MMTVRNIMASMAAAAAFSATADPVELTTFAALARPSPTAVLHYGPSPSQAIDLFIPGGDGPHPVAILVHGGCWSVTTAGREQLRHLGEALADRGIAVWSIGYRRANEAGGGYPGTYEDVAAAIDRLPSDSGLYRLDLSRTVLVGHSAGGHLALWAAVRDRLPPGSRLHRTGAFVPQSVISLAGVGHLEKFARFVPLICGDGILEKLVPSTGSARVYADVSPAELPPPRKAVMISGVLDRLVPPYVAHDYARAMQRYEVVDLIDIAGAGHFDMVTLGTPAWDEVRTQIERAVASSR